MLQTPWNMVSVLSGTVEYGITIEVFKVKPGKVISPS